MVRLGREEMFAQPPMIWKAPLCLEYDTPGKDCTAYID